MDNRTSLVYSVYNEKYTMIHKILEILDKDDDKLLHIVTWTMLSFFGLLILAGWILLATEALV